MNLRRHQLITDLIQILMQFMFAYLLIILVLCGLNIILPGSLGITVLGFPMYMAVRTLFLLPVPFLSYAIRKRTKHVWSFLAFHAAMLLVYLFLTDQIILKTVYGIYITIMAIYSYYQRQKTDRPTSPSLYTAFFFLLPYLASYLLKLPDLQRLSFFLAIAYTLLNILSGYLMNMARFAKDHADIRNIPFRQIQSSNHVLVAFLCGLLMFTMLLFSYLPLGKIITSLGRLVMRGIRFLLSFLPSSEPEEPPAEAVPEEEAPPEVFDLPPAEPSRLMQLISDIFQWIMVILLIAAAVALVLYTVYRIYRYFYLKNESVIKEEVVFLSPNSEKSKLKRAGKHTRRWPLMRSNNELIRRSYVKAVTANTRKDGKLSQSLTPSQLSDYALGKSIGQQSSPLMPGSERHVSQAILMSEEAGPLTAEDNLSQTLTAHYEKARYGNEECTRDEVREVKEILRRRT